MVIQFKHPHSMTIRENKIQQNILNGVCNNIPLSISHFYPKTIHGMRKFPWSSSSENTYTPATTDK